MADEQVGRRVLNTAEGIIYGDRHESYGPAEREFERVATGWSALFGAPVSAKQVALAMVWLKVCREDFSHKEDNLVDMCGYAALAAEIGEVP